jgi:hypothetical protein
MPARRTHSSVRKASCETSAFPRKAIRIWGDSLGVAVATKFRAHVLANDPYNIGSLTRGESGHLNEQQ